MTRWKLVTWEVFLRLHPFRIKVGRKRPDVPSEPGDRERTLYVSSPRVATAGLPAGWGILEAHRYDYASGEFVEIP